MHTPSAGMEDLIEAVIGDLHLEDVEKDIYSHQSSWPLPQNSPESEEAEEQDESSEDKKSRINIIQHSKPKVTDRNVLRKFTLVGEDCPTESEELCGQRRSNELITAVQSYSRVQDEETTGIVFRQSDAAKTSQLLDMFEEVLWYNDEQDSSGGETSASLVQSES